MTSSATIYLTGFELIPFSTIGSPCKIIFGVNPNIKESLLECFTKSLGHIGIVNNVNIFLLSYFHFLCFNFFPYFWATN